MTCLTFAPRLAGLLLIATAVWTPSFSQEFPAGRTIRIVVPAGPASPPDAVSRLLAAEVSQAETWRIVVENRPGALQTIALSDVLNQPADALSIFPMSVATVATPPLLQRSIRLDADFVPVVKIASGYSVLVVNPTVPANSIAELIDLLRSHPNKFSYSSGGFGTPGHLLGELFKLRTGASAAHVPYPQPQQRISDLLSGVTQFSFFNIPTVVDLVASGKLRALAVTAPQRLAALQDIPTVSEEGRPDLVSADWIGLVVKTGAPPSAVNRLRSAFTRAMEQTSVRDSLVKFGYLPDHGSSEELGALIGAQLDYWRKVVTDANLKQGP